MFEVWFNYERGERMVVDGRTQEEADEYIKQCSAPSEVQRWEIRAEKPVKLWVGARVHHKGVFVMAHLSIADAKRHVENEERWPVAILLDGRLARRERTRADAETMVQTLRASVEGNLTIEPHVPRTHSGGVHHHRADAKPVLTVGDWTIYPSVVVGKFDTVAEAEAHRDKLVQRTAVGMERFTITGAPS